MTLTLDIARASVATRLIGDVSDAGRVDHALQKLLETRVLPEVAARMEARLPDEAILCLPQLPLSVSLTLEEALGGKGSEDWVTALVAALSADIADFPDAVLFENRGSYMAAYLKMRLGIWRGQHAIFSGFDTLDLMAPLQVAADVLRLWPDVWSAVAEGGPKDQEIFVKAVAAQGGPVALAQVLAACCDDAGGGEVMIARDLAEALLAASQRTTHHLRDALLARAASGGDLTTLAALASLALAGEGQTRHVARLGCVMALLLAAQCAKRGETDGTVPVSALKDIAGGLPAVLHGRVVSLLDAIGASSTARAALKEFARTVNVTPAEAVQTRTPPSAKAERAAREAVETPATAETETILSPIAGMGLLLPLLTENHIGAGFPARMRLAALAALAGGGPVEDPEVDPVLRALCGADNETALPDRPNALDLLFVAPERKARIEAAAPGVARLVHWLEARFAASLPGLSASSRAFLQAQFLHRPGRLILSDTALRLELDAPPLNAVLRLSGLTGEALCSVPWLEGRVLSIALNEAVV